MTERLEKIAAAWAIAGGAVLLLIALVTVTNAGAFLIDRLARLAGGTVAGLPGYEDFVRLAVSGAALMLFPYCQARRGHIAVDLLVARLAPALRRALDRLAGLGIAALALFLAYWMAVGMVETRADHALSRVLGWPEWPFYLPGIVSLLLWAAIAAAQALERDGDG
ncbi:MAG: TRAP transporter small permease [Alphaproteobacteria bacterium]|nr:TRAP transporter small permease [Alphaproteobacteria bacterium]